LQKLGQMAGNCESSILSVASIVLLHQLFDPRRWGYMDSSCER